jgi:hypothetical protein
MTWILVVPLTPRHTNQIPERGRHLRTHFGTQMLFAFYNKLELQSIRGGIGLIIFSYEHHVAKDFTENRGYGLLLRDAAVHFERQSDWVWRVGERALLACFDCIREYQLCSECMPVRDYRDAALAVPAVQLHAPAARVQGPDIHLARALPV